MSAFPPHRSISSIPISQSIALKYLSTYLSSVPTTPYLLPNAKLEVSGPAAGSSSSVTIHNLQRVEAGLRGKWLEPVLEFDNGANGTNAVGGVEIAEGMDDGTAKVHGGNVEGEEGEGEGWQDLDEYQREQSIEVGEIGPRQTGVQQEVDSDLEESRENVAEEDFEEDEGDEAKTELVEKPMVKRIKVSHDEGRVEKTKDKEARKAEKKAREKNFKRAKAAEVLNKNKKKKQEK